MKKLLILVVSLLLAGGAMAAPKSVNPKPFVVPELREWRGAEGQFTPTATMRIVYNNPALADVAAELAADMETMFDIRPTVAKGSPAKGDISLTIAKDKKLGKEGYKLEIGDVVKVSAPEAIGNYWGTRSILQILESNDGKMPKGIATDFPSYPLRGFSLDVGRKFFPMSYLQKLPKILSYYKMNSLRIHLNDNGFPYYFNNDWNKTYAAFRLESDTYPGLAARDGYYTKNEFRQFQKDALKNYVTVVPEIDIPAHALAFAHYKPELGSKEFGMDHLNLFNPELIPFLDKLYLEYITGPDPVFVGERVHIGTDEFGKDFPGFDKKKETAEKFRSFMDHYIRLLEENGKKAWVWGSLSTAPGETPIKTDGVLLDAWYNGYADPKEMIKLGFKINSIPDRYVYIVPMAGYYYDYLNTDYLYNKWSPINVGGMDFEEGDPNIIGGYFAVWNDHCGNGVSVKDVHHRFMPAVQTISTKTWDGTHVTLPYAEFDSLRNQLSEAPGINELGRQGRTPGIVYSAAQITPGKKLPLTEIGYNYTIEFDLEAAEEEPGTVLFESPNAKFYIADPTEGMFGFTRDGYLNKFSFKPYVGEKVHVVIKGDNKSTSLTVNGKTETLDVQTQLHNGGKNKMYYIRTLVFPLQQAGMFNSKITNFKVFNF